MRSMKLLVATALVAALVAGPVLAQDAMGGATPSTPASTDTVKPVKHTHKKHTGKKHHKKATTAAPSGTPSAAPATMPAQ
jgi:hypothetical protein